MSWNLFKRRRSFLVRNAFMRGYTTNLFQYKIPFWLVRISLHLSYRNSFLSLVKKFDWHVFSTFHEYRWFINKFHRFFFKHFNLPPLSLANLFSYHITQTSSWKRRFSLAIYARNYQRYQPYHIIRWSTRSNKMILLLQNKHMRTYVHLYSGLFIKFFEKRKALRKSKLMTLTMFHYFRTLLLLAPYRRFIFIIKGPTPYINELFSILQRKPQALIAHLQPRPGDLMFEKLKQTMKFLYLFFLRNQTYCFTKIKSRGRIKRKIRRRLVKQSHIPDL